MCIRFTDYANEVNITLHHGYEKKFDSHIRGPFLVMRYITNATLSGIYDGTYAKFMLNVQLMPHS